jgi:hypothetical protein
MTAAMAARGVPFGAGGVAFTARGHAGALRRRARRITANRRIGFG